MGSRVMSHAGIVEEPGFMPALASIDPTLGLLDQISTYLGGCEPFLSCPLPSVVFLTQLLHNLTYI